MNNEKLFDDWEEYKEKIIKDLEEIPSSAFLFWELIDQWIENNRNLIDDGEE